MYDINLVTYRTFEGLRSVELRSNGAKIR